MASPQVVMLLLDNSDFSINGDYLPTRWRAQIDAASLLIEAKINKSQSNCVGVGLMGGQRTEVLCTPTTDSMKASSYLFGVRQHGSLRLGESIQIAALALKHRADPALKQRIICFVCSTICESTEELKIIGKKLKKNNIALDMVVIGDIGQAQRQKAGAIFEQCSQTQTNTLLFGDSDISITDLMLCSRILCDQDVVPEGNLPEIDDPDLINALRLSLQLDQMERQQRQ